MKKKVDNEIFVNLVDDEDFLFIVEDYFRDNPEKEVKFNSIYKQGRLEGLSYKEILTLFIGGELANDR